MTHYLLAVNSSESDYQTPPEEMQQAFADVDRFNTEAASRAGRGCSPAGCTPADTATVVDATEGDALVTDGPFAETKEQLGGFWVIEAPDLDAALDVGDEGARRHAAAPSRCGRSRTMPAECSARSTSASRRLPRGVGTCGRHPDPHLRRHRRRRGGGSGGLRDRHGEMAGDRLAAEPWRLDRHDRPQPGHRPAAPRGEAP